MCPHDPDEARSAATPDEEEATTGTLNETVIGEQATQQLQEALSATESSKKDYHVREALQLFTIDDR